MADDAEERHVARENRDRGAVLRGIVIEVIDGTQAAGPRHVLDNDVWLPRNVTTQMACNEPAVDIVTAAGSISDDQIDLPPLEKIGWFRIGASRAKQRKNRDYSQCQHQGSPLVARVVPYRERLPKSLSDCA